MSEGHTGKVSIKEGLIKLTDESDGTPTVENHVMSLHITCKTETPCVAETFIV